MVPPSYNQLVYYVYWVDKSLFDPHLWVENGWVLYNLYHYVDVMGSRSCGRNWISPNGLAQPFWLRFHQKRTTFNNFTLKNHLKLETININQLPQKISFCFLSVTTVTTPKKRQPPHPRSFRRSWTSCVSSCKMLWSRGARPSCSNWAGWGPGGSDTSSFF